MTFSTSQELSERIREQKQRRDKLFNELQNLQARERAADEPDQGLVERVGRVNTAITKLDEQVAELEAERGRIAAQEDRIRELAQDPRNREAGTDFSHSGDRRGELALPLAGPHRDARDAGLRTIERYTGSGELRSEAADRLDELVRGHDRSGVDARYLAAVGDPAYNTAVGKLVADPAQGHSRFTPAEVDAVQKVAAVQAERAMSLTGASGGFAVPFTLDPSVLLTSSGALNPVRQLARQITVSTDQWKGVSSTGVTASYVAEATAATDASPTLVQPVIDCAQGRAFVPFSIELGMDWTTLQQELVRLIADGRDVLDATQFLTGTGTDSPAGVLTGLTTTQRVQTAGAGAIATGDLYTLKAALPARFIPNATWALHPNRLDSVYRLTPAGSTTEPQMMPTRDGALIGKPVVEWTTMATASTTGTKYALYGDFQAGFTIADRVGMTVELIPHIFGAAQGNLPTGQRGLYAYWRTGSVVTVPNAFRYGEVL